MNVFCNTYRRLQPPCHNECRHAAMTTLKGVSMRLLKNRSIRFYLVLFLILTMAMGGSAFAAFANPTAPVFKLKWGSPGTGPGQFGANLAGIAVDNNGN